MKKQRLALAALVMAAAPVTAALAQGTTPPEALKAAGKIVFCSDLNSPPSQYMSEDGVTPDGVAVDMIKALAANMGLELEIMNVKFSGIFAALDTGRCDAIMASTSRNPERLEKYNFVDYWQTTSGLLVKAGNPDGLKTFLDLSGKRVAVLLGSANERRLKQANEKLVELGKPEMEIITYNANTLVFQELDLGRVDAMVSDSLVLSHFMARSNGKFEIGGKPVPPATLGMIVAKPNTETAAALTASLDAINADGTLPGIVSKWHMEEAVKLCTTAAPCSTD